MSTLFLLVTITDRRSTDAFGVVAMVAMTPLITVQLMGLVAQLKTRKARQAQHAAAQAFAFAGLADDDIIEL